MPRLFGTDGVRGIVNRELTPVLALEIGRVLGGLLRAEGRRGPVCVGRDTRRSGPMLQAALSAGLCAAGIDVRDLGVLSTPGVAWRTRNVGAAAGVMISASHNPPAYNGIKIFSGDGYKLPDALEEWIETALADNGEKMAVDALDVGLPAPDADAAAAYLDFLQAQAVAPAEGLRVVLDCGNGAVHRLAPELFRMLGADVIVLNDQPDGTNINRDCGSTHPHVVAEAVRQAGADVGFSFDGDADRCIAVDDRGQVIDGDVTLGMIALRRHRQGDLPGAAVVATVMSNLGLERTLERAGITLYRTAVGDRHVLAELLRRGLVLGGEQSGHIVFLDCGQTTGDGLLTAVQLLNLMLTEGRPLSELAAAVDRIPQRVVNVAVTDKDVVQHPAVRQAVTAAAARLGSGGRILVRASGTEPVVRVLVESVDADLLERVLEDVTAAIREGVDGDRGQLDADDR